MLASAAASSSAQRLALVTFEPAARTLTPVQQPDGVASGRDGTDGSCPPAFIRLSSVTDLIIDGGGSKITFADYCQFVDLLNCSRVQIVRFEFDLEPLPYTALAIESVDPETSTATMRLRPGHPNVEALLPNKQLETSGIAEVMSRAKDEVCSYGLCSYGLYSYGLYSYGLHSYGLHSYGLCILWPVYFMAYIVI